VSAIIRPRLLVALIVLPALAALLAFSAFSPSAKANHAWGGYHWAHQSNPFTLQLGDNVSPTWDPYLKTASFDWSKSSVLDTTVAPGLAKSKNCRPTSGRVEVCNGTYGNNGWLGIAQIWASGTHITQGTTKMNDTYFNTPQYNTIAWRHMVMCQEVGHTFGLDHQDEVFDNPNLGTCMDYTNDPTTNQHPNQGDYDELSCIYDPAYNGKTLSTTTHSCTGTGHFDSTTTVGSASAASPLPHAAKQGTFNSQADWGHKIRDSGKFELWERNFGGGSKVVTWVIRP
jgi:hypothetical protein